MLGPPRQRAVLVMLALRAGYPVTRDQLVDGLWGSQPPVSAVNVVHTYVAGLRRGLEPGRNGPGRTGVLSSAGHGLYVLRLDRDQLDVGRFDACIGRARQLRSGGDPAAAAESFDAALAMWHGTPLAGIPGPFAEAERARLTEQYLVAAEDHAEAMLAAGRHAQIVGQLARLIEENPFRERLAGLLIVALSRNGRQSEALAAYQRTRQLLVEELGIEPGQDLRGLHDDILHNRDIGLGDKPGALSARTSAAARVVPRQLPPAVRHFTGRRAEMNALSDLAGDAEQPADAVVISAIGGAAGIGKTALAVHWAHQVAGQFPDGQLHADLRGFGPAAEPVSAAQAARAFVCALGVTREAIPAEADALVGLYRSLLAGRRMLVVLDNVRDESQVRPLLPGSAGCLVLVTSRNQLTGLAATEGARLLTLGEFTEGEAREFLVGRLGAERVGADPEAVSELTMLCARLPLALAITAARAAAQPSYPLADVVAELRDAGGPLDALETGEAVGSVRAVFSWSYRLLSPPAARLFRCLGLHPGPDVSVLAAASMAGLQVAQARQLLTELGRSHLINEHILGRYALHDLLRVYAAEQACAEDGEADRRVAIDQVLDHYLHTACTAALLLSPLRDPITFTEPGSGVTPEHLASHEEALYWFEAEHKVLLAAVNLAAARRLDSRAWQLPWALADFLDRRGHWHDWAAIQRTAVEAAACIGDTSAQALAHRLAARASYRLADYDQARAHLEASLGLYRRRGDRIGEARIHQNLSVISDRQERLADSLGHDEQALSLFQAAGHRAGQASVLNSMGLSHIQLGDPQRGRLYCRRALAVHRELGNRAGEAYTWDSLGRAEHQLGHHAEAAACYQHALRLFRELGDRPEEAETLVGLGDTCRAADELPQARDAWQQALAILDDLHHPDAAQVRARLALPRARKGSGPG